MTNFDPAIEAARRAWDSAHFDDPIDGFTAAAREALKPIRAKCEELDVMFDGAATDVAAGVRLALTQIVPLIYSSKESDRG